MDPLIQAIHSLQSETLSYTPQVQMWMKIMGVTFLSSIVFVYWRTGARWILAILVVNLVGLVLGKVFWSEASRTLIGTYVHLIFWPPLLIGAIRSFRYISPTNKQLSKLDWVYATWLAWACLLVIISLLFDARAAFANWG